MVLAVVQPLTKSTVRLMFGFEYRELSLYSLSWFYARRAASVRTKE